MKINEILKRILCIFGIHDDYDWHPYPKVYPECVVERCKTCDKYEWR